jgi:hypothetical protein
MLTCLHSSHLISFCCLLYTLQCPTSESMETGFMWPIRLCLYMYVVIILDCRWRRQVSTVTMSAMLLVPQLQQIDQFLTVFEWRSGGAKDVLRPSNNNVVWSYTKEGADVNGSYQLYQLRRRPKLTSHPVTWSQSLRWPWLKQHHRVAHPLSV